MSETFERILLLVRRGEVKISNHGYDQLAADGLSARDALLSVADAVVVEEYPDYLKAPASWSSRRIEKRGLYMSFGASRREAHLRRSS